MKQKAEPVVSEFSHRRGLLKELHKYDSIFITVAIVVIVIVAAFLINNYRNDHKVAVVCSSSLINQSEANFSYVKLSQLSKNVSTIKKLSNYQRDPNCMYVLTVYYTNSSQPTQAESSLNTLNKYSKDQKLDSSLVKYKSVADLSQEISNMEKDLHQIQLNTEMLSPKTAKNETVKDETNH